MGVQTAPALFYVPSVRGIGFPHKNHQFLYYPTSADEMSEHEMSKFIEEKSGVEVRSTVAYLHEFTDFMFRSKALLLVGTRNTY